MVDDCISLSGYVIYIDNSNNMIIYDNTVAFNAEKSNSLITEDKTEKAKKNAIENIKSKVNMNDGLKIHEVKKVYDINTGEKYIYITVEHKLDGTDAIMLLNYTELVE